PLAPETSLPPESAPPANPDTALWAPPVAAAAPVSAWRIAELNSAPDLHSVSHPYSDTPADPAPDPAPAAARPDTPTPPAASPPTSASAPSPSPPPKPACPSRCSAFDRRTPRQLHEPLRSPSHAPSSLEPSTTRIDDCRAPHVSE